MQNNQIPYGAKSEAARRMGIKRTTFNRKFKSKNALAIETLADVVREMREPARKALSRLNRELSKG